MKKEGEFIVQGVFCDIPGKSFCLFVLVINSIYGLISRTCYPLEVKAVTWVLGGNSVNQWAVDSMIISL